MNDFSYEIWESTYKGPDDNTPEDTWKRLAKNGVVPSDPEGTEEKFYELVQDWKFVPGGRIMSNLGINSRKSTTLYNCFVHAVNDTNIKDPDSIDGIYTMLKAQAHTLKSEGGYGINASWIRPRGTYVKGIGSRTPGVVKFMELWNKSSEIITMGSDYIHGEVKKDEKKKIRKGAQMLVLNVWHPEIKEFITAKQTPGRLDKFNISAGITNGFMEALKNDELWNLEFPDTSFEKYHEWDGDLDLWKEQGYPVEIYETIPAREIWDLIMKSTYNRNDPGVLFLDLFNKLNPLYYAEKIFTTNPCVTGDTIVQTDKGKITILELINNGIENYKILSYDTRNDIDEFEDILFGNITKKNADIIKLELEDGKVLKLTPDHLVYTSNRGYIQAKDLTVDDDLRIYEEQ